MLRLLAALLLTFPLFAADLQVTIEAPERVDWGVTFPYRVTIHNAGADTAVDVRLYIGSPIRGACYDHVAIDPIPAGETRSFECTIVATTPPYDVILDASVWASNETNRLDDGRLHFVKIITPPDLALLPIGSPLTRPGIAFKQSLGWINHANVTATGVTLTITTSAAFGAMPEGCDVSGGRAVCRVPDAVPRQYGFLTIELIAPDTSNTTFTLTVEISSDSQEANPEDNKTHGVPTTYRTFWVVNTNDEGTGSLRAAIEEANTCNSVTPCLVAFRIPPHGRKWVTIKATTPLPRVTGANLTIDGKTQTDYYGDTNPLGPEVEITGSPVAGNGIEMAAPCDAYLRGLAINGFPGAGVAILPAVNCPWGPHAIASCYIGVDPTGERAVPNERGITVDLGESRSWSISDNVISGNRRAGIFVEHGRHLKIERNVIGLNAKATAPVGNGASGVYLSDDASSADLANNHISFNGHFGVAIARGAKTVSLIGNSFQANGQQAIDYELDGLPSESVMALPVIASARFEDGATIIEGTVAMSGTWSGVSLYANDAPDDSGYGEGQYYLGQAHVISGKFTMRHAGDLRGKWIAATKTEYQYFGWLRSEGSDYSTWTTTGEFSRAVEVH